MQRNSAFDGALSALPDYIIKLIVADIPFNVLTFICRQFGVFILSEIKLLFPNIKNNLLLYTKYTFNSLNNVYFTDKYMYKIIDNKNSAILHDYKLKFRSTKYFILVELASCENKIRGANIVVFDQDINCLSRNGWHYTNKNIHLANKPLCQYLNIDVWLRNNKHITSEHTIDDVYQEKLYNKILNLAVDTIYAHKLIII
jgi:hypothetical protein